MRGLRSTIALIVVLAGLGGYIYFVTWKIPEGGADPTTRLEALATKLATATPKQPKHVRRTDLHVTNQFHPHGELVVDDDSNA